MQIAEDAATAREGSARPGFDHSLGFLPLERMREVAAERGEAYRTAHPFPHVLMEDFFEPAVLDRVLEEFPYYRDWEEHDDPNYEIKRISKGERQLGPFTRQFIYALNSATFINFLESLTGIEGLISDPHLWGGGLHETQPGGKLSIHVDFNRHPRLKLDRRLNLLVYLNHDWDDEWGGNLELWERDMSRRALNVPPRFNRVVCFNTTEYSFHGHPDPLRCPAERTRRSLALYYYTAGRPTEEVAASHSTMFQERPGEQLHPSRWNSAAYLRGLAKRFVPPILLDLRRSLRGPQRPHPNEVAKRSF